MSDQHVFLTVKEVASYLRCGLSTVYELFGASKLLGFKIGAGGRKGIRIYKESVDGYIKQNANGQSQPKAIPSDSLPKSAPVAANHCKNSSRKAKAFKDFVPVEY